MSRVMHLDGELTIYRAAELKPLILEASSQAGPLEIDLSGVSEIDSAGVQLLMLARRELQALGHALRLVGHSAAVREVFDLLDLAAFFAEAPSAPAARASTQSQPTP